MKKNMIALLLSVVMASGSIGSVPVFAAETTAQEAVAVEDEASEQTEEEPAEAETSDTDEAEEGTTEAESVEDSEQDSTAETIEEAEVAEDDEEADSADTADISAEMAEEEEPEAVTEEEVAETEGKEAKLAEAGDVVASGRCGEHATWTLTGTDDDLTLTISGSGAISSLENYKWWLWQNKTKTVIVNEGITEIKEHTFNDFSGLTRVTLPESMTSIGRSAFYQCTNLESITIPDGVTSIEDYTFYECSSLKDLTLPNRLTTIGKYAFSDCGSLESITIPASVKNMGERAFACCGFKSIIIQDGVTSIGGGAFSGCANLTSITIPESVTSIEGGAFSSCGFTSITIPESVTSIGVGAFDNCYYLKSISIQGNVTSIEDYTFNDCYHLESITIPDTVTSIGDRAFSWCCNLTNVVIPDGITRIGNNAFYGSFRLTRVIIPDSTTVIGEKAFYGCDDLTDITIPDSVTELGTEAFGEQGSNTTVRFRGTKEQWDNAVGDNEVYYKSIVYNYFSVDADFKLSGTSFTYTGKAIKPAVTVTYNDQQLIEGTDYELVYKNTINAGKGTVSINGIGNYSGTATKTFTIKKAANQITAKNIVRNYSTKNQTFAIGVKISNGTPKYASDNKSVTVSKNGTVTVKAGFIGKATITVTAPEYINFSKTTKKMLIVVNPPKTGIASLSSPAAGKMTVNWKKNALGTGYQIQYSTSNKFTNAKSFTVTKNTIVSKTFTGLAKGKKYYVRMRTYKTVGGVKFYSGWCIVKTVTIRK